MCKEQVIIYDDDNNHVTVSMEICEAAKKERKRAEGSCWASKPKKVCRTTRMVPIHRFGVRCPPCGRQSERRRRQEATKQRQPPRKTETARQRTSEVRELTKEQLNKALPPPPLAVIKEASHMPRYGAPIGKKPTFHAVAEMDPQRGSIWYEPRSTVRRVKARSDLKKPKSVLYANEPVPGDDFLDFMDSRVYPPQRGYRR